MTAHITRSKPPQPLTGLVAFVALGVFLAACSAQYKPVPSFPLASPGSQPVVVPSVGPGTTGSPEALASSVPTSPATEPPAPGATPTDAPEPAGTGEGTGTGEGSGASYTNTHFGYSVDVPGQMIEAADGSAAYDANGETLHINVVTGAAAADPMNMAQTDFGQAQVEAGFNQVEAPAMVTISGRSVVRFVYQSLVGLNPVTGNPYHWTNVRYYIPGGADRLAVVAYAAFTVDWDPQNADDLETSFTWL